MMASRPASTCIRRAIPSRPTYGAPPGIDAASNALGHADLTTALGIYRQFDTSDLEVAMGATPSGLHRRNRNPNVRVLKICDFPRVSGLQLETVGIEPTNCSRRADKVTWVNLPGAQTRVVKV
jgi:hypothetical protein